MLGRSILLFDGVDRQQLAALGEVRTPSIADLFVAVMGKQHGPLHKERHDEHVNRMRCRNLCAAQSRSTALSPTQPFYWSVRREFWENRSIYIAPLALAGSFFSAS